MMNRIRIVRCSAVLFVLLASPVAAAAQECKFLCEPGFSIEPTITIEQDDTIFETIFALDLSTAVPWLGLTLEASTKPFSDDNEVEIESELNLEWLSSSRTGGWLSSHFDIIDQLSPAERPTDTRAYTHKLNFELDTGLAVFNRLPESNWLHDVEIEGSIDYVATGLPKGASRWSMGIVFSLPILKGR